MSEGNSILTEIAFWGLVIANQEKKVVSCNPEHESKIKTWIDARGLGRFITVVANPHCPIDTVFIMKDPDWWPQDAGWVN